MTFNASLPAFATFVDLKVMLGYFATSKKSVLLRCVSRSATLVSMLFTSMVASTVDFVTSDSSRTTLPR